MLIKLTDVEHDAKAWQLLEDGCEGILTISVKLDSVEVSAVSSIFMKPAAIAGEVLLYTVQV